MEELLKSINDFIKVANIESYIFWVFPLATVIIIYVLSILGPKLFSKRKRLKTIFIVHKAWILSSLIVSAAIIGLLCYWWSLNYFSENPLQLSLLISLFLGMLIMVLAFISLRNYYSRDVLKEIIQQPKTQYQLEETISYSKKEFSKTKLFLLIPIAGFLMLFFSMNKGQNLISLIYDNSSSMELKNASEALSETFENLEDNNEITITTLDGLGENSSGGKTTMNEILTTMSFASLRGGNVIAFNSPLEAKNGLSQLSNMCYGSPICEATWKTYLYIKETKANQKYRNQVLVILTDGVDNVTASLAAGPFFFDNEGFAEYFPPEKVFIIDYSGGVINPLLQRFIDANCEVYNIQNNKQEYLDALDSVLKTFKNNWYLIYWTIILVVFMTAIAFFIDPKKTA